MVRAMDDRREGYKEVVDTWSLLLGTEVVILGQSPGRHEGN